MGTSRSEAVLKIRGFAATVSYHIAKVLLFPRDINQNKWRNEIASNFSQVNRITTKMQKGSKLPANEYTELFILTDKFSKYLGKVKEQLTRDGYTLPELSISQIADMQTKCTELKNQIIPVLSDKKFLKVETSYFREILDDIL